MLKCYQCAGCQAWCCAQYQIPGIRYFEVYTYYCVVFQCEGTVDALQLWLKVGHTFLDPCSDFFVDGGGGEGRSLFLIGACIVSADCGVRCTTHYVRGVSRGKGPAVAAILKMELLCEIWPF